VKRTESHEKKSHECVVGTRRSGRPVTGVRSDGGRAALTRFPWRRSSRRRRRRRGRARVRQRWAGRWSSWCFFLRNPRRSASETSVVDQGVVLCRPNSFPGSAGVPMHAESRWKTESEGVLSQERRGSLRKGPERVSREGRGVRRYRGREARTRRWSRPYAVSVGASEPFVPSMSSASSSTVGRSMVIMVFVPPKPAPKRE
jgi:hypothetical protein